MPVIILDIDTAAQIAVGISAGWIIFQVLIWTINRLFVEKPQKFKRDPTSPFR